MSKSVEFADDSQMSLGLNDDSLSHFDQSVNAGATEPSDDIVIHTPSAQMSYQGRPMSQPKTRVFKLEDTNLLDFANNTTDRSLLAVVGVHTQDSDTSLQPPSPGGLTWTSLSKSAKQIAEPRADDRRHRPDVKRRGQGGLTKDHEIMKTMSLSELRHSLPPKFIPDNPFDDPTGNLRCNTLLPKRIDTFPTEESKMAKSAHLKELQRLRKYKQGVPPSEKLKLLDRELAAVTHRPDSPLAAATATSTASSIGRGRSFDTRETEPTLNINIELSPPSPAGFIPGYDIMEDNSVHSQRSLELVAEVVSPVLTTKRKPVVVKNIPEEKLGYYKRVTNVPTSSASASALAPQSAPPTAPPTADSSVASSRGGTAAESRADLAASLQQSAIEAELMGRTRPLTNNPLQRYRMEQKTAERVSSREPIRCSRCSKDSTFWCRQCCLSFCHNCWGTVPHHGFVSTTGLPSPPKSAGHQDMPFSAFPALKKSNHTTMETKDGEEHLPVYAPTRSSVSRVGASIRMLRTDKPFYKGLQMSDDAIRDIDLTLFGGLEGMKGNKQPRPRSGRPDAPGAWRKPVKNPNNDRGMLAPKKKKKGKKKKMVINIPNMSVAQSISGRSTLSLGTTGAPPMYAYPMTGITHDFFPEDWKETRPNIDITVCKGVPVYTVRKEHFNQTV